MDSRKEKVGATRSMQVYWTPTVVLVLALVASAVATYFVSLTSRARDQLRFQTAMRWTRNVINERLRIYTCGLSGGAALFGATGDPTRPEFKVYAERLNLHKIYPGIQGFGFARRTSPDQREALIARMHEQGDVEFQIKPPGEREEYFPIVYLEPLDRRNAEAIGYDMYSEPLRHEAMVRARDSGEPAASGKVTLVQEIDSHKQAGFLIYVPVYRGGKIPKTEEERRKTLTGFVYSPFRAGDLFAGIFHAKDQPDVHLEVYDGAVVSPQHLMYQSSEPPSEEPTFTLPLELAFAGHRWTLLFRTTPEFDATSYSGLVPWVFAVGSILSVILCGITAALARAHRELQRAQEELRNRADALEKTVAVRTARLRETVAELEQMSYSIVHDMRAPLRAIQSFSGMLEEETGSALSTDCRGYLHRMKTAASRMDALIRDVLNYGKIVREDLPLYPVDVSRLLLGMVETYPSFQPAVADISVDPAIPVVRGNEAALTQCFSNLLSNAVRFAQPGQRPKVAITATCAGSLVRICVADEGVGIPKELHGKVFGLFQRLHTSPEGTGMGLAIVRKAVERMGGKITLESEEGRGARFYVDLQAAEDSPRPVADHVQQASVN